ncbi:MAG: translation initiation factor IF-2 [Cytophagaceae bacterium]|nr:translation initiation factor IF-2 [Cytophagaceae bacterium]
MAEELTMRLSLAAKKINVGMSTIVVRLSAKGFKVENNPNTKLTHEQLQMLSREFHAPDLLSQEFKKSAELVEPRKPADEPVLYFRETRADAPRPTEIVRPEPVNVEPVRVATQPAPAVVAAPPVVARPEEKPVAPVAEPVEAKSAPAEPVKAASPQPEPSQLTPQAVGLTGENRLGGLKVLGKIDLNAPRTPVNPVRPTPEPEAKPVESAQPTAPARPPQPVVEAKTSDTPVVKPETPAAPSEPPRQQVPPTAAPQTSVEQPPSKPASKVPESQPEKRVPAPDKPEQPKKDTPNAATPPADTSKTVPVEPPKLQEPQLIEAKAERLQGLKVIGKIQLPVENGRGRNPVASSDNRDKKKRKRINKPEATSGGNNAGNRPAGSGGPNNRPGQGQGPGGPRPPQQSGNRPAGSTGNRPAGAAGSRPAGAAGRRPAGPGAASNATGPRRDRREEPSQKDIQDQIKVTMARLSSGGNRPNFGADKRRERRRERATQEEIRQQQEQEESKILKVTEFISANDLASLMDVSVNEVISVCMSLGMFVSINQRLDAEAITIISDEFGYGVQFVSAEEEVEAALVEASDEPEDLVSRAPIVTIMGHVDHGKTSLLDYIRRTKVAAGEAGGITQHIGAYDVMTDSGKRITFLDTPGHEAFTAMRARGAQVTDVVIIVIAADDSVMPQTREAINHAQNANVPIVFAFSKVDKAGADTEKIRQELAQMNLLVEEWGGKYQTQEISSKSGLGVADLLEKVLLESELLELKANPNRRATGAVLEASLDKGRGYVTTILVQNGTLRIGDIMLAGEHFGRVKAMFDHRGQKLKQAGPSEPAQVLGLAGAPQAGDKLNVLENEREAREIANKREQILREQNLRTRKHITLEEIGRRKAIGTFKELNVIVKGDVDGSVEALSDSLLKLSTEEVQVRIIHKGVGQVSESDVLLASTSDAIVVAFQVRPSVNARRIAEQEQIEIRNYSIIYDAINEVRDAMEGLLAPSVEETITATVEVREVFKISKVGTVAGCYVTDGTIKRNNKIRLLRDFIVVHEGEISALKRFKDDVAEVRSGYECGLSIRNFHDILVGDVIECYELKEVKRTL